MRRVWWLAAIGVVVVGLVLVASEGCAPRTGGEPGSVFVAPATLSVRDEVGGEHVDIGSARAAAVAAVASTGVVVRAGMFSRNDVVARFATAAFAPVLASRTASQLRGFVDGLRDVAAVGGGEGFDPAGLVVVEVPVTAVGSPAGAGRVRVEVWSVVVVSVPGLAARQVWRTVTVEMTVVSGRWLVDAWDSVPGPSPAPPASGVPGSRVEVAERLGWPVVGSGEGA